MAVILTDMNMPHVCMGCDFHERFDNASGYCKRKPYEIPVLDTDGRIPKWCPLKPLPLGIYEVLIEHRDDGNSYGTAEEIEKYQKIIRKIFTERYGRNIKSTTIQK